MIDLCVLVQKELLNPQVHFVSLGRQGFTSVSWFGHKSLFERGNIWYCQNHESWRIFTAFLRLTLRWLCGLAINIFGPGRLYLHRKWISFILEVCVPMRCNLWSWRTASCESWSAMGYLTLGRHGAVLESVWSDDASILACFLTLWWQNIWVCPCQTLMEYLTPLLSFILHNEEFFGVVLDST